MALQAFLEGPGRNKARRWVFFATAKFSKRKQKLGVLNIIRVCFVVQACTKDYEEDAMGFKSLLGDAKRTNAMVCTQ